MSLPGWHNGWGQADLDDFPEDQGFAFPDTDVTLPSLTLVGGLPYEDTYIIRRQGDEVLTPNGWFDIDELEELYE